MNEQQPAEEPELHARGDDEIPSLADDASCPCERKVNNQKHKETSADESGAGRETEEGEESGDEGNVQII
jgi:hypothetical protein